MLHLDHKPSTDRPPFLESVPFHPKPVYVPSLHNTRLCQLLTIEFCASGQGTLQPAAQQQNQAACRSFAMTNDEKFSPSRFPQVTCSFFQATDLSRSSSWGLPKPHSSPGGPWGRHRHTARLQPSAGLLWPFSTTCWSCLVSDHFPAPSIHFWKFIYGL